MSFGHPMKFCSFCFAESSQLLDGESRYLPVPSELSMSPLRPFHLHSAQGGANSLSLDAAPSQVIPSSGLRPSTAPGKNRIAANFTHSDQDLVRPTPSESQPQPHTRKRAVSPVTKAMDLLECDSESDGNVSDATLELKLLKALLADRKTKKALQKSLQQQQLQSQASTDVSLSSSPYRVQYSPDRYTSPTRKQLLKRSREILKSEADHSSPSKPEEPPRVVSADPVRVDLSQGVCPWHAAISPSIFQFLLNHSPVFSSGSSIDPDVAAVRLQAAWRGYHSRHKDPFVLKVRQEIRSRRAEDHIRYLSQQLERSEFQISV